MSATASNEVNGRPMIIDYHLTIMTGKARVTIIYNSNMICSEWLERGCLSGVDWRVDSRVGAPRVSIVGEDVAI
jgi:hypothetical protein